MEEFKGLFISKEFSINVCLVIDGFIKRILFICETPKLSNSDIKAIEHIAREWMYTFNVIRLLLLNANKLCDDNALQSEIKRLSDISESVDEQDFTFESEYVTEFKIRGAVSKMLCEIEEKREMLRWKGERN